MGFRFRKSIKVAKGVRLNISKSGISTTFGGRGASVNVGRRGIYGSVGIPGTGIYARERLGKGSSARRPAPRSTSHSVPSSLEVKFSLQDDGRVEITDQHDNPLPPKLVKVAREQNGERIQAWLEEQCDHWNQGIEDMLNIHLETPPPTKKIIFEPQPYEVPPPAEPREKPIGILGSLFQGRREAIIRMNQEAKANYIAQKDEWENGKKAHEELQTKRKRFIEEERFTNNNAMQEFLTEILEQIDWPRETLISFQVTDDGKGVLLDVDLPEIEDMPKEVATVASRGLKVNVKERSEAQRRKEYMAHIHGVLFRVIGEVFVALPTIEKVVISGFSQRADKSTGQIEDDYLISLRVSRPEWHKLNFENLELIDLPASLGSFEIRRKMTKTGVFSPIEPFDSVDSKG